VEPSKALTTKARLNSFRTNFLFSGWLATAVETLCFSSQVCRGGRYSIAAARRTLLSLLLLLHCADVHLGAIYAEHEGT
jgi:hypothetical protein